MTTAVLRSAQAGAILTSALSRLTRILLLVAVALCLGAPTAGAAPAKLDNNLAALWTTILQTPKPENPFKNSSGAAFTCVDLGGGIIAPFGPAGAKKCTVNSGTKIFVAAFTVECSTFPGDGPPPPPPPTEAQLRKCARAGDVQVAPTVTVDDVKVQVTEVETPLLNIVLPDKNVFGEPAGTTGQSVGHGWVTLLALTPGTHTIVIDINPNDPDTITTTIVVKDQ